jgi:hypothetical protein
VWLAAGNVLPMQPYQGAVARLSNASRTPTTQDVAEAPLRLMVALPDPGSQPSVAAAGEGGSQVLATGSLYLDDGSTLAIGAPGDSVLANITVTTALLPGQTQGSYVLDYSIVNGPAPQLGQHPETLKDGGWVVPTINEVLVLGVPAPQHTTSTHQGVTQHIHHISSSHPAGAAAMAAGCPASGFTATLNGAPLPETSTEYTPSTRVLRITLATRSEPSHPGGGVGAGEDMRLEWSACAGAGTSTGSSSSY